MVEQISTKYANTPFFKPLLRYGKVVCVSFGNVLSLIALNLLNLVNIYCIYVILQRLVWYMIPSVVNF